MIQFDKLPAAVYCLHSKTKSQFALDTLRTSCQTSTFRMQAIIKPLWQIHVNANVTALMTLVASAHVGPGAECIFCTTHWHGINTCTQPSPRWHVCGLKLQNHVSNITDWHESRVHMSHDIRDSQRPFKFLTRQHPCEPGCNWYQSHLSLAKCKHYSSATIWSLEYQYYASNNLW